MPTDQTIFELIATEIKNAGIPYVLVGGFAVNYHGYPRATQDLDLMIADEDLPKAKRALEQIGFQMNAASNVAANFKKPNFGLKGLDLLLVSRDTFNQVIHDGAKAKISGTEFIVPSLNHLIALKLHAMKSDPKERELKDLPDVVYLLRVNKVDVRTKDFQNLCLKFGTPKLYESIVKYFT